MSGSHPVTAVVLVFDAGAIIEDVAIGIAANEADISDVVIVDNGCQDGSAEVCERLLRENASDLRIERLSTGTNLGVGAGHWQGWERALGRGHAVLALEHDTVMKPRCVERLLAHSSEGFIVAARLEADKREAQAGFQRIGDGPTAEISSFTFNALLLRPNQLRRLGPPRFDLFVGLEDFDYSRRAHADGLRILQVNEAVAIHRNKGMRRRGQRPSPRRQYYSTRNGIATQSGIRRFRFITRQGVAAVVDASTGDLERALLRGQGILDAVRGRMGANPRESADE